MADYLIPIGGGLSKKIVDQGDGIGAELVTFETGSGGEPETYSFTLIVPSATEAIAMVGYTKGTIQFTVASINTNVVVRAEASNVANPVNAEDWFNLNVNNVDTTITANMTDAFRFDAAVRWIRGNFLSEAGGSDAIVTFAVRLGK